MSAPTRPKLLPMSSFTSTRYEIDFLDQATGQWHLAHQRADLTRAKKLIAQLRARSSLVLYRLVAVSETRRLIPEPVNP